ncbi:MAG: Imm32 family immunity protein [Syntrophobacteraceae bacterium]
MTEDDLLTFELDPDGDQLFIHGNPAGLLRLVRLLHRLAEAAARNEFPHTHLFTKEWGGDDLSSQPQAENHRCLNHVKIYGWPGKRGSAPYSKIEE